MTTLSPPKQATRHLRAIRVDNTMQARTCTSHGHLTVYAASQVLVGLPLCVTGGRHTFEQVSLFCGRICPSSLARTGLCLLAVCLQVLANLWTTNWCLRVMAYVVASPIPPLHHVYMPVSRVPNSRLVRRPKTESPYKHGRFSGARQARHARICHAVLRFLSHRQSHRLFNRVPPFVRL